MKHWPTKPLGGLIAIEKGKKAPEVFGTLTTTRLRYLQIEDLRPDANLKYCEPFTCPRATKSDVVIAWDGANAGTVSCNLDGQIGSTLAILRPTEPENLSATFLSRFLQGNFDYLQKTATGATIPHVSKNALTVLKIPIPPLVEQERIVKLLDEADELRRLRAQADHRTANLIPALFHEMFGDPISNNCRLPTSRLGEIASVERGRFSPRPRNDPSYFGGIYPFIQTGDIAESGGFLTKWKQTLNERGRRVSKGFPARTIVIAIVGATIGQTAILAQPVYATDSVIGIRPQPEHALTEYVMAVLEQWRPVFIAQAPET